MESYFVNLLPVIKTTGKLVIVPTLIYPFINAKTLIELGHKPMIASYLTETMSGSPVLHLQSVFKYVKYIYEYAGINGCYRGFLPWVLTKQMYSFTFQKAKRTFLLDHKQNCLTKDKRRDVLSEVEIAMQEVVCRSLAIIISQPLYVLTIRTIAQFIGKEEKYNGIFPGLWTILREEGVEGLFSGLVPRLMGEILQFTLATVLVQLVHKYVCKNDSVDHVVQQVASRLFNSFTVDSYCMAVSNCGLEAGLTTRMPLYPYMLESSAEYRPAEVRFLQQSTQAVETTQWFQH